MAEFHFLRPLWLLALLPMAGILLWLWRNTSMKNLWAKVCDPHLLPHLLIGSNENQRRLPVIQLGVIWLLAIIALAGPTWSKLPAPVFQSNKAQIIALDTSTYMYANDIKPSRFQRARFKALSLLKHITEGQVGLVAFSREGFIVSPLTDDANTVAQQLSALDPKMMPVQGSSLTDALQRAASLLERVGSQHGQIILITAATPTENDMKLAESLQQQGIQISVLGVGTRRGSPIPGNNGFIRDGNGKLVISKMNDLALAQLAKLGGGVFTPLRSDDRDVNQILQSYHQPTAYSAPNEQKMRTEQWSDQGRHLMLLLLPLAALAFRRGWMENLLRS